ncbi:MAG: DUF4372 domain-containing protein [Bryobacteraceae bacterium]
MNRACGIFSPLLPFIPRAEFARAALEPNAERHARGSTCWTPPVAMLFCQLGRVQSLRKMEEDWRLARAGCRLPA